MMYAVKRSIDLLSDPLVWTLIIVALAAVFRVSGRLRIARWLLVSAAVVGYSGSTTVVGDALLEPLERQYLPLSEAHPPAAEYVVVLGTGYSPHDDVPITAALAPDGLVRLVEGVRLMRHLGASHLVVSGGAPPGAVASALGYARLARDLGTPEESLVVLDGALDTGAEADVIAARLGKSPFILVTSAYHMPRAVRQMLRAGARPIPAPTGQMVSRGAIRDWRSWLPSVSGLGRSQRALHEYLGFAALAFTRIA